MKQPICKRGMIVRGSTTGITPGPSIVFTVTRGGLLTRRFNGLLVVPVPHRGQCGDYRGPAITLRGARSK
jgi:hypothetical protein